MASPRASIPKSPCSASAGCRKNDGVPVLESVAEIFRPISPDFPMPVTATRPLQAKSTSTALAKLLSRRAFTSCSARASISSTLRAVSRLTAISAYSLHFLKWGAGVLRPYGLERPPNFQQPERRLKAHRTDLDAWTGAACCATTTGEDARYANWFTTFPTDGLGRTIPLTVPIMPPTGRAAGHSLRPTALLADCRVFPGKRHRPLPPRRRAPAAPCIPACPPSGAPFPQEA